MDFTCVEKDPDHDFTDIMEKIPELRVIPADAVRERIGSSGICLLAEINGQPVGFKLGYALSPDLFYSWLGGVTADCRGQGVARALMEMQERLAYERGFRRIRVKSMNCFPAMLRMLISSGYAITDLEKPDTPDGYLKVVFEKPLVG